MAAAHNSNAAHRRGVVANRVAAAVIGGYVFSSLATATFARWLPAIAGISRAEGTLAAILCGFVLYTLVVLWAFSIRSVRRVWMVLVIGSAVLAVSLWMVDTAS